MATIPGVVKHKIDTAAQLAIDNDTFLNGELIIESDTSLFKFGDGSTPYNSLNFGKVEAEIAEKKTFFTFKDRSSKRLEPFDYDNAVSTSGTYATLFVEIGDIFEKAHTDIGDPASGVGLFYPTPPPGSYARSGIPDISFINTDVSGNLLSYATPSGFRDGTIFRYELLTGTTITNLVTGTEYFLRRVSSSTLSIHPTEVDAIADTNAIAIADGGVGTFRLTQEGIAINGALVEHNHGVFVGDGGGGPGVTIQSNANASFTNEATDGSVGDVKNADVSNENRVKTYYEFEYISY